MPKHQFLITVSVDDDDTYANDPEWWADAAHGALTEYGAETTYQLIDATPDPATQRVLDASSQHLPADVCGELNSYVGVVADEVDSGWLLWVPPNVDSHVADYHDDDKSNADAIPEPVIALWRYARERDCTHVMIDDEAQILNDLPTY